jgi:protein transport protein SEC23
MEPIRQHKEIETGKAPLTQQSVEFFTKLGQDANANSIVIDYIGAGFEETGVHEISPAVISTGGFLLSCETWNDETISNSLIKFFGEEMLNNCGLDGSIKITVSPEIQVRGCVGPCLSCKTRASFVSDKVIGEGATNTWHASGLMPDTTLAVYFDVNAQKTSPIPVGQRSFIQFSTKYRSLSDGKKRERITTFAISYANLASEKENLLNGCDQQAASVLLSKLCVWKARTMPLNDVVRFLDKTLIDTCRAVGYFTKGKANTLQLPSQITDFPLYLYHFRRSSFMSTFNSAPDQTMAQRIAMIIEDVNSCLLMIRPMLKSYPTDAVEPTYVPLEMTSLLPKTVLFLDTYFRTLVWYGSDVAAWRNQGIQNQEGYKNLKTAIEAPVAEAKEIHDERFPSPQLITCDQDSSLSRYLLVKCNPTTVEFSLGAGENLGSDEPSYDKFFNKLKVAIVK